MEDIFQDVRHEPFEFILWGVWSQGFMKLSRTDEVPWPYKEWIVYTEQGIGIWC